MSGENLVTQASLSAGEVNSTELTPKEKYNARMRAYMREYRKKRRAAQGLQNDAGVGEGMGGAGSSLPDASA